MKYRECNNIRFEQSDRLRLLVQQRSLIVALFDNDKLTIQKKKRAKWRMKGIEHKPYNRATIGFERIECLRLFVERTRQHNDMRWLFDLLLDHLKNSSFLIVESYYLLMYELSSFSQFDCHHTIVAAKKTTLFNRIYDFCFVLFFYLVSSLSLALFAAASRSASCAFVKRDISQTKKKT